MHQEQPLLVVLLVVPLLILLLFSFNYSAATNAAQYQQHNNILHFWIDENVANGSHVGNIRSADGQPPYLVVPGPQTPEAERLAALRIDLSTGDIYTNSILDRETREQYQFVAIVNQPFAEVKCTVTVRDSNDNAPKFLLNSPNDTYFTIEIPEGQRGVRRLLPLAVDADSTQFGIKEFRIVFEENNSNQILNGSSNRPSSVFQLVEHEAPFRSGQLQASLQADDISAIDVARDNPQLLQQLAQQVSVLIPSQPNLQSNSPTVSSTTTTTTSSSSSSSSSSSLSSNLPSVPNSNQAQITPIIANYQSKFLIDLEVNQPLDRENQSSYQFVVEAIDGGQPPLLGKLNVIVKVLDINDNEPIFTRRLYERGVTEDTAKGTLLVRVQAHDDDLDENSTITYSIKSHQSSSQPIPIITNSSDNYDNNSATTNRHFSSPTTQTNNNSNINSNIKRQSQTLSLQMNSITTKQRNNNNINNNDQSFNTASIPSTSSSDSLNFKSKLLSNSHNSHELFEIDPVNGEIYLLHSLDYETDQWHELIVEARDHGKIPRSSTTTVRISVIDVNDDPPPQASTSNNNNINNNARIIDTRDKFTQVPSSEASKSESSPNRINGGDLQDATQNYLQNLLTWFSTMHSSALFVTIFAFSITIALFACFVKIKSRQPESDYNDTAGLTLSSNNGQTKQSPNHSTSNEHSNTSSSNESHHRHQDHQRRSNGILSGPDTNFATTNGKLRYQLIDPGNFYHNPYPSQTSRHIINGHLEQPLDSPNDHQMASVNAIGSGGLIVSAGGVTNSSIGIPTNGLGSGANGGGSGSAGGTMNTLHHHHHHHHLMRASPSAAINSLERHHQFTNSNNVHHTNSLTYAHHHSRAPLTHQAHHHQSSHHLSSIHQNSQSKGGTMNSVGTHNSAHHPHSTSPIPVTPNTTQSSGLPINVHENHHHHHNNNNNNNHHRRHNHQAQVLAQAQAQTQTQAQTQAQPIAQQQQIQQHQHQHQQQQQQQHHGHHHANHNTNSIIPLSPLSPFNHSTSVQQSQMPTTPCNAASNIFSWPQTPGSTMGCLHGSGPPNSSLDCALNSQPLDRWFDLGVPSQLVYAHDWYGSYNWDYLTDWTPDYQTLMPLLQADSSGY